MGLKILRTFLTATAPVNGPTSALTNGVSPFFSNIFGIFSNVADAFRIWLLAPTSSYEFRRESGPGDLDPRLVIGYMEGAAEEEEELKTKRVPKHSEACGNAYMVACLTFYNRMWLGKVLFGKLMHILNQD